jgi:hypothetical protein
VDSILELGFCSALWEFYIRQELFDQEAASLMTILHFGKTIIESVPRSEVKCQLAGMNTPFLIKIMARKTLDTKDRGQNRV